MNELETMVKKIANRLASEKKFPSGERIKNAIGPGSPSVWKILIVVRNLKEQGQWPSLDFVREKREVTEKARLKAKAERERDARLGKKSQASKSMGSSRNISHVEELDRADKARAQANREPPPPPPYESPLAEEIKRSKRILRQIRRPDWLQTRSTSTPPSGSTCPGPSPSSIDPT